MSDTYTETTRKSWGTRLGDSFKGIIGGIILVGLGIYLLFWNEGRTVKNKRAFQEGASVVISVPIDNINSANEGKLIYITGNAVTDDSITDPDFGITVNDIALKRSVEMFQWKEDEESKTEEKLGGSEETTTKYTYKKVWSDVFYSSDNFKKQEGHENPAEMLYKSATFYASNVNVGAFSLNSQLISSISGDDSYKILKSNIPDIEGVKLVSNQFYVGEGKPTKPKVGDVRVSFTLVKPHIVSIIAKQVGNSLQEYTANNGKNILMLNDGVTSSEQMFKSAIESNKTMGWLLRLAGLFIMFIGFSTIFKPLSTLADVVPFIGNIVAMGTGLIAFILTLIIGFIVIAIAWMYFRPGIGISLIAGAIILIIFLITRKKKKIVEVKSV